MAGGASQYVRVLLLLAYEVAVLVGRYDAVYPRRLQRRWDVARLNQSGPLHRPAGCCWILRRQPTSRCVSLSLYVLSLSFAIPRIMIPTNNPHCVTVNAHTHAKRNRTPRHHATIMAAPAANPLGGAMLPASATPGALVERQDRLHQ